MQPATFTSLPQVSINSAALCHNLAHRDLDLLLENFCWNRKSHAHSLSTPALPRKDGLWTWNTFLPRDKEPTQSAGRITLCGKAFPWFTISVYSFVLLKCVLSSPRACPQLFHVPWGREEGVAFYCGTREVHVGQLPCVRFQQERPGHWGTNAHY